MVAALALNADATRSHVALYYWCTALLVLVGGVAWVAVVLSPPAQHYFNLKDAAQAREEQSRPSATATGHQRQRAASASGKANDRSGYSPPREKPASAGASGGEVRRYALLPSDAALASLTSPEAGAKVEPLDDGPVVAVDVAVRNCRLALFINIWSSIFVGAFFA